MSKTPIEITITGILGNDYAGNAYSPLYVPLEQETDLRVGHVEPTADKLGNDPNVDVSASGALSYWDLLGDLSQGAWHKNKEMGMPTYDEPMYTKATSTTLVQALAWTLNKDAPLMPGCGLVEQNGSYSFAQFIRFQDGTNNRLYALDVKSNKVYYNNSETWTDTTASGAGNVTELAIYGKNDTNKRMYLGRTSGNAYYYNGSAWTDAGYAAEHFVQAGKHWYYSKGNRLKKDATGTNALDLRLGTNGTDIGALLWFDTVILALKPEALFVIDPVSKIAQDPVQMPNQESTNSRFLVLHDGSAWFPVGQKIYELTRGFDIIKHRIAKFEGSTSSAFTSGVCVGAHSDGNNLYFAYKVTTATTYDYFLVVYTGAAGGFHPVLVVSVLKANDPAYTNGGIWFDNNKLRYSFGNDKTGYLWTDGEQPLENTTSSVYFTRNVGIWLGWFSANRDHVTKWIKGARVSLKDTGATGQLRVSYKKFTDTSSTDFPTDLTGTQDNAEMTPTAESSAVAGFKSTKINIGLQLRNSDSTPENVWYLKSAHLVGAVTYGRATIATFNVLFDFVRALSGRTSGRSYDARRIKEGLLAGIAQAEPVQVTLPLPNATALTGRLQPNAGGEVVIDMQKGANAARREKLAVTFQEYA